MASTKKLFAKLSNGQASFTWTETVSLLNKLGYEQIQGNGSRVKFFNKSLSEGTRLIILHQPHPNKEIGYGAAKSLIESITTFFDGE